MTKKMIFGLLITIITIPGAFAQIKISKPDGLEGLMYARTAQRKHPDAVTKGYHILIFNGDSRNRAEGIKSRFDTEYRFFSEVVWDEPNFKVYVGLFISKFECMKLYDQIKGRFQTTIVVNDKIRYQPLF